MLTIRSESVGFCSKAWGLGTLIAILTVFGFEKAAAITKPSEVRKLLNFKDKMIENRGDSWAYALESWTCPPQNDTCDPW
jgi:hypothetical protein